MELRHGKIRYIIQDGQKFISIMDMLGYCQRAIDSEILNEAERLATTIIMAFLFEMWTQTFSSDTDPGVPDLIARVSRRLQ